MSLQAVKSSIASQPPPLDLIPKWSIRILPHEIVGHILFFTNHSESTRLVSWEWNILTFTATINSNNHELKQTISLITEKFNSDTHAQCITDLVELPYTHQFLSGHVTTFAEVRRLFFICKGSVIGILRTLPLVERGQLQQALDDQFPDSMQCLFGFSMCSFESINHIDLDLLFTLLHSYQPLQRSASEVLPGNNPQEFVRLLLANGPISEHTRGLAVESAAEKNILELVRLLLADGPISIERRGLAVESAAENNNTELVLLLLANGPISEVRRGWAAWRAAEKNNPEFVRLLLTGGAISQVSKEFAVESAVKNNNFELVRLLLAGWPISEKARGRAVEIAAKNNNLELVKLLLADGPISIGDREKAVWEALDNNNLELLLLLWTRPFSLLLPIRLGIRLSFSALSELICYPYKDT